MNSDPVPETGFLKIGRRDLRAIQGNCQLFQLNLYSIKLPSKYLFYTHWQILLSAFIREASLSNEWGEYNDS